MGWGIDRALRTRPISPMREKLNSIWKSYLSNREGLQPEVLLLMGILCAFIILSRDTTPLPKMDGRYFSQDCGELSIAGNRLAYGNAQTDFDIARFKFGIEIDPKSPLDRFYIRDVSTGEHGPSPIEVSDDGTSLSAMDWQRHACSFQKRRAS
jgi:hypothetical protein